jgi:hypothetical protein
MRKRFLVVMLYVCGVIVTSAADQGEKYTTLVFPENMTLGMTRDAIQSKRPAAMKLQGMMGSRNTNAVVLTEVKGDIMPLVCYQYHFIDDHLRAVTKGIGHGDRRDEQTVKSIHDALARDLVKQADEKILRLNTELEQVSVEFWKDEKSGTCVYFVDTSNDTSVIVFDPKYFGKKDFFITPDEMPQVAPAVENVRKTIEESKKLKK